MQSALDYLTRDESRFVEELCDYVRFRFERRQLARLPHADATYRKFLGMPELFGEMRFTSIERRSARPTPEINGLTSGHRGEGSKTIIPTPASAKLTLRLVPNQKPDHIAALVRRNLKKICPRTVRLEIEEGHDGEPCLISPTKPLAKDGLHALKAALAQEPVLMREGRIDSDHQRIQESSWRRHSPAGSRAARRQRPLAK